MSQDASEHARNREGAAVTLARLTIFVERAAPIVVLGGAPIAALTIASLFDAWTHTPQWAHAVAILSAIALSMRLTFTMRRGDLWPTRAEALARLEKDGGVRHDALQALEDAPIGGGGPLWDAHVAEMKEKARAARLNAPIATANRVDPFGARYAALAVFVVAWIAAGEEAGSRLFAGFIPSDPRAGAAGYADVWIEPPSYTGKAPIYLIRATDALPGLRKQIEAPEGSIVYAQVNARNRFRLALKTGKGVIIGDREGSEKSARAKLTLLESGVMSLRAGGRVGRWPIEVIDDRPPVVDFVEGPAADRDGRLALVARIDDDYGAASASLRLSLDPEQERPLDAPEFSDVARSESRLIAIEGLAGNGARAAAVDLQSDPWAGLAVIAAMVVTDAAGQSGESAPVKLTLPAKPFFNPLAKAVIEQRQSLAVSPEEWRRAEWAFNGLTLGPEYFFDRPTEYLLLRTAMWRINKTAGGDYKQTVEEFWPLALQLEDEALELARRRLDAARQALRDALENGASDSEIERLTEEMRAALQQYLQALAQSGEQQAGDGPPADRVISSSDLEAMLDSIRDLAKSGADGAARQALSDLENLLSNLRMSGRQGGGEGQSGKGGQGGPAGAAGDLIGRQRELADKSFERGQKRGAVGDDLADEQGGIASELSELVKSLEGANPQSGGEAAEASQSLGDAMSAMRQSQEALKGEDFDAANDAMERAIASLRDGAEKLARGQSAEARAAASQNGAAQPMRDPLGRPIGQYGEGVEVPEKSDAQRTRELLQELRRRLSDGERTEEEIKYLERLLERF